jgi:rSAM/selenodomain-associated transferase 2/rSAM/selenodomain-associated transferase 1
LTRNRHSEFSVVIPTLNEEESIGDCVARIRAIDPDVEVIIADGGSADETIRIAARKGVAVCSSGLGRGRQLNAGAALASGSVVLFLHADTRLPSDTFHVLREYFRDDCVQIGMFRLAFDSTNWLLNLSARFTRYDSILTSFGDQCIVMRKSFFDTLGGFPEWPLFEDVHLLRRARKRTRVRSFPATVTTSPRRFVQNGYARQFLLDAWYMLQYLWGVSPERIAAKYGAHQEEWQSASRAKIALILLGRFPRPGKVKTRLAQALGEEQAAVFYRLCAERAIREGIGLAGEVRRYFFYSDPNDEEAMRLWVGPDFSCVAQKGKDLGERSENAFKYVFGEGAQKAVIAATDVPDLAGELIAEAFAALEAHDIVVGPCPDGGYYLLGTKAVHRELLSAIPWSTDGVLDGLLRKIESLGLTAHLLASLPDIDTIEDLRRWSELGPACTGQPIRDFVRALALKLSGGDGWTGQTDRNWPEPFAGPSDEGV